MARRTRRGIEQAQQAAERYEFAAEDELQAGLLKARLEAIRLEVEELRRGGWRASGQELRSKRINLKPDGA